MGHYAPGFTSSKLSALQAIQALGLTTGLQLCLDAGDENSYTSGQVWNDRSGNAYNFNRGSSSGAEGSDPTFNGTAGQLSGNEFWSFDGGDYFTLGQANPTSINNLHKNNAVFALAAWIRVSALDNSLFGTGPFPGILWLIRPAGVLRVNVQNGSGTVVNMDSVAAVGTNAWTFIASVINEAAGTGLAQINSTQEVKSVSYSSPSSSNAPDAVKIGAEADNDFPLPNGSRIAMFNAWEGTIPTAANLLAFYNLTRGRFGV